MSFLHEHFTSTLYWQFLVLVARKAYKSLKHVTAQACVPHYELSRGHSKIVSRVQDVCIELNIRYRPKVLDARRVSLFVDSLLGGHHELSVSYLCKDLLMIR